MSTRVNRQGKVSHAAAPPTAREPNAMAARSAANRPRPIAAPLATLLTVLLATLRPRRGGAVVTRVELQTGEIYMNVRGGRRGSRTWLARQARTYASTSVA